MQRGIKAEAEVSAITGHRWEYCLCNLGIATSTRPPVMLSSEIFAAKTYLQQHKLTSDDACSVITGGGVAKAG